MYVHNQTLIPTLNSDAQLRQNPTPESILSTQQSLASFEGRHSHASHKYQRFEHGSRLHTYVLTLVMLTPLVRKDTQRHSMLSGPA